MRHLLATLAGVFALGAFLTAAGQNRVETQLLIEMRALQEQVQRMQLAVNQLAEKVKATEARIDAQVSDNRKGFADQKVFIDSLTDSVRTLSERENAGSVRINQLSQEMKSIREGLAQQQTSLNEIINLLQPLSAAAFASAAASDPASAAGGAPPASGSAKPAAGIPPSPTAYYNTAFGYYYRTDYESAIDALEAAIKRFPDHPDAARAQLTIGHSYYQMGKRFKEALAAFTAVITNYKDPDVVSDAYYNQGLTYEALGQKDAAIKSYETLIKLYKDSSAAILAGPALQRLRGK